MRRLYLVSDVKIIQCNTTGHICVNDRYNVTRRKTNMIK